MINFSHAVTEIIIPVSQLPFHNIDPILVAIPVPWGGVFEIRWYSLAYICGIVIAWWWIKLLLQKHQLWDKSGPPMPPSAIDDIVFTMMLGVIIGGRLGYVIMYNPVYFLTHPLEILYLWEGGMSFHGGLAGVIAAAWWESRKHEANLLCTLDLLGAAAPAGLFFGRVANFINSELPGRISSVPWAMPFPGFGPEPRHPSQLYEAALEGVLLLIVVNFIIFKFHSLKRPGLTAGIFATGYGLARIAVETLREPDAHIGFFAGWLTMGMILSLPMVIIGLILVRNGLKKT